MNIILILITLLVNWTIVNLIIRSWTHISLKFRFWFQIPEEFAHIQSETNVRWSERATVGEPEPSHCVAIPPHTLSVSVAGRRSNKLARWPEYGRNTLHTLILKNNLMSMNGEACHN